MMMEPVNVGVEVEELFGMIGHLYVEATKLRELINKERYERRSDHSAATAAGTNGASISPALTGEVGRGKQS